MAKQDVGHAAGDELCHTEWHRNHQHICYQAVWSFAEGKLPIDKITFPALTGIDCGWWREARACILASAARLKDQGQCS